MSLFVLLWALAQTPCEYGGKGAQCVTCQPSDRGTVVCRGVCYSKRKPRKDGADAGYASASLQGEDKDEAVARRQVEDQAKEKCR